jgi:hypothetical protein
VRKDGRSLVLFVQWKFPAAANNGTEQQAFTDEERAQCDGVRCGPPSMQCVGNETEDRCARDCAEYGRRQKKAGRGRSCLRFPTLNLTTCMSAYIGHAPIHRANVVYFSHLSSSAIFDSDYSPIVIVLCVDPPPISPRSIAFPQGLPRLHSSEIEFMSYTRECPAFPVGIDTPCLM